MTKPPRPGTPAEPKLGVARVMEVLRSTVPTLEALTAGVPEAHLRTVTDYGWSVNDQLAHLRACHDVLGGSMLRIVREAHPAWRAVHPRTRLDQSDYFEWQFADALGAFRAQRAELLAALDPLGDEAWHRTASVTAPPNTVYEYSVLYYGDWMARHERGHLAHMRRILAELATR